MKDMKDREIDVGDLVVYVSNPYGTPRLTEGIIVEIRDDALLRVKRLNTSGNSFRGVKDGVCKKWVWDPVTNKGDHVPSPAQDTFVACDHRVMILKKASEQ